MALSNGNAESGKRFNDHDLAVLERSEKQQESLRSLAKKGKFSAREQTALKLDSIAAFDSFWHSTKDAQANFEIRHERGVGRAGRQIQNFGEAASDMMQQLGPIVQAIRDFGYPFGGMAIGTIAFFFTIAHNKASVEVQVAETLHQIRDRIAGFRVYERIYNDDHDLDRQLQSQVVQAYDRFIAFCIVATKYYTRNPFSRWLRAISGSSSSIGDHASQVQVAIVDVRRTTEELLNKNVDYVKQINIELRQQMQQMQESLDNDRLQHVQNLLCLETSSRKPDWQLAETYLHDLEVYFADWIYVELMRNARIQSFLDDRDFQAWHQSTVSKMLILVGYNNISYCSSNQCWLSPFLLHIIEQKKSTRGTDLFAFYLIGHRKSEGFQHILSTILIQLLHHKCQTLRYQEQYAELCAELETYQKSNKLSVADEEHGGLSNKRVALFQQIALKLINMLGSDAVIWIILDRIDRSGSYHRSPDGKKILQALVQVMEKAEARLQILALVNGYDWPLDETVDELGHVRPDAVTCVRVEQGVADE